MVGVPEKVLVGLLVGVFVGSGVEVMVGVEVTVGVPVLVGVSVGVEVEVWVAVKVGVGTTTLIVLLVTEKLLDVSVAVIVWVPVLKKVAKKMPTPLVHDVGIGNKAVESVLLKLTGPVKLVAIFP